MTNVFTPWFGGNNPFVHRYDLGNGTTLTVSLDNNTPFSSHPLRVEFAQWEQQDNGDMVCLRHLQYFMHDVIAANQKYRDICKRIEEGMQRTFRITSVAPFGGDEPFEVHIQE